MTRWPTPLSMQLAGTKSLPSILLAPMAGGKNGERENGGGGGGQGTGAQISITFRLADDNTFNVDGWAEWLRLMPGGIAEARVEGPYRGTTFQ